MALNMFYRHKDTFKISLINHHYDLSNYRFTRALHVHTVETVAKLSKMVFTSDDS